MEEPAFVPPVAKPPSVRRMERRRSIDNSLLSRNHTNSPVIHSSPRVSRARMMCSQDCTQSYPPLPESFLASSATLSRSSLCISQPRSYQTLQVPGPPCNQKPKLCTPLIPHKSYRSVRIPQNVVHTTVRYHANNNAQDSESNV